MLINQDSPRLALCLSELSALDVALAERAYGHGGVGFCVDVTVLVGAILVFNVVLLTESAILCQCLQIETVWATDGVAVFAKPLEPLARKGNRVGRANLTILTRSRLSLQTFGRLISD